MDENQAQQSWFMSTSAFKALFYPLPAVFLDAAGPGMLRIDARSQSVGDAFTDPDFEMQSRLLNLEENYVNGMRDSVTRWYTMIADDEREYNSLGGCRTGVLAHQLSLEGELVNPSYLAHSKNVTLENSGQILVLFGTARGAAEYADGLDGDNPSFHPTLARKVEQKARELGVHGLGNPMFQVLDPPRKVAAFTCSVQNVYLRLMMAFEQDSEDIFVSLTAKAITHLHRQLVHYRSTDPSNKPNAPSVLPPDPHMCAYCGKEDTARMHCSRCKIAWYCSPDCQTKHWKMQGPFSHRRECKSLADPLVVLPAIPVGRLVMIHGLQSDAGKRMNGKDAFVVTQPTDNGRLGVVLEDDISEEEVKRLQNGNVSRVPSSLQKAIKTGNLELVWSPKKT